MNLHRERLKRRGQYQRRAAEHKPQLGYVIDTGSDIQRWGKDHQLEFDFCPKCKVTVELIEEQNKYNPKKTVMKCPHCKLIQGSVFWKDLAQPSRQRL